MTDPASRPIVAALSTHSKPDSGSLLILAVFVAALVYFLRAQKHPPFPPGPRKLPLIGNLLDVPLQDQWVTFSRMAKEANTDILHLNMAGTSIIVLESQEAITELLDRRSAIYSSRPTSKVINELVGWSWAMVLMPYDDLWKERRRIFQKYFNPSDTSLHRDRETEQLHIFLNKLLDKPQDFGAHIRHLIGAITITMSYGIEVKRADDPHIKNAEQVIKHLSDMATPGTFLVEYMPFLEYIPEWFPGTGWKAKIKQFKKEMNDFLNKPYEAALQAIEDGTLKDCFMLRYYQDLRDGKLTEEEQKTMKEMAGQVFTAGADTTVSSITTFFLAMVTFPDVFKKAQEEVDRVLKGRLPEHDDIASMPYLGALLKEVLRWQPIFPLGVYHSLTQDDVYKGYHIPAGSIVLPDVWTLSYDPVEYPEPEVLRPERFLKDGQLHIPGRDPSDAGFGFGRRICQGRHIGESMWFLCAASVLALFDITKAVDDEGNVIQPDCEFNSIGTIRQPGRFVCSIKPRSREAEDMIRSLI